MSRSNPEVNLQNPATRFFKWHGDTGTLSYYDKEKKEDIGVKLPFKFLTLDDVVQVGGGIKRHGEYVGYFSNAVRSREIGTRPLVVKTRVSNFTTVEAEGVWGHIKSIVPGAKYVKGLYIAFHNDDGELVIGYLKLQGAANSAFIQFCQDNNIRDICSGVFTLKSKSEPLENGNTTYYAPIFGWSDKVSDETDAAALVLDQQLQTEYLIPYFAKQADEYEPTSGFTGTEDAALEAGAEPEMVERARAARVGGTDEDEDDIPF